jgi:molecular chaperone HscB
MKNFFEIFNFPIQFKIDLDFLEKKYLEFQRQFHPDKSSVDDVSKSIEINEAYKILADDFLRACYLLELNGIDILRNEKAAKVDQATLERVLELQEIIFEIINKNEIKELEEKLNSEIKFLISAAAKCLESMDLELATQFLIKVKYLKKSLEDLKIRKKKI